MMKKTILSMSDGPRWAAPMGANRVSRSRVARAVADGFRCPRGFERQGWALRVWGSKNLGARSLPRGGRYRGGSTHCARVTGSGGREPRARDRPENRQTCTGSHPPQASHPTDHTLDRRFPGFGNDDRIRGFSARFGGYFERWTLSAAFGGVN